MHVVGTAGHVDHGKSTLVHALTGIDPDRFEEEKRRGLTIDLGFAWCTLPSGREIGIVDVPGHERFIRNMLAGVGGIDAAIFVVAADEGWMPQSAEHLQILDFLDVRVGVVALTKCDAVGADDIELIAEDVWQRLRGTCLHGATIVRVSATTGAGLDDLRSAIDAVLVIPGASDRRRPRLFVDRSFTITGSGTVVTGTLTGGRLRVDDEVEVLPSRTVARIRTLQTHRRRVDEAFPGSRVAANLVGLERTEVRRGDAITYAGQWILNDTFAARLRTAWDLQHHLTERGAYELHVGSAETTCAVKFLEEPPEVVVPVTVDGGLAAGVRPDSSLLVQIFARRAIPLEFGDRFIVRDVGRRATVAGGVVLDPVPGTIRRNDAEALHRLRAREGLTRGELAARIVTERGAVRSDTLGVLAGIDIEDIGSAGLAVGPYLLDPEHADALRVRALELLAGHHDAHPLAPGMPTDDLRRALALEPDLFGPLVATWQERRELVREEAVVRLPQRAPSLPQEQRAAADRALDALRAAGASAPSLRELGISIELAKALERMGEVVLVSSDLAYPADMWADMQRRIIDLISTGGPVTVSRVREAIGTSRKYAVPLLEHMDATGITRRSGDVRDLGPRGRELAGA